MSRFWKIVLGIVLFLVILNFALEPVALYYANKALGNLKGYKGHIEDVDIHLYRGAYRIDSMDIVKVDGENQMPFFSTAAIDISIQWSALFKGSIVGEIILESPRLNFMVVGESVQAGGDNDWVQTVKDLIPLQINRFQIMNGEVHYIDNTSQPQVDLGVFNIQALATNLGNVNESNELLPSRVILDAGTSGSGKLNCEMAINPLKQTPDFDLSVQLDHMDLTYLKDFTEAYAYFNFKEGQMYLSSEVAMKNGEYEGYVKPILKGVRVIDLKNKETSFWRKVWEVVVGTVLELFENQKKDQFATKVPFSGNTRDSKVGLLPTIG
ncbi:MAG TPA: hypothetical protein DCG19_15180, partial [Cryomorphaceae bacterium]|nr:hypothetical protein [Cryomorphaceae bacterium]